MKQADAENFCEENYPVLLGVLIARGVSFADAEDIAQETLVRVVERWNQVRSAPEPRAWAIRVALNLSTSRWRRLAAEARAHVRLGRHREVIVVHGGIEDGEVLVAALRELPARQRTAVALRFIGDLSVAGTAKAMDCHEGTVKALTSQGLASLRARLKPNPDGETPFEGAGHG